MEASKVIELLKMVEEVFPTSTIKVKNIISLTDDHNLAIEIAMPYSNQMGFKRWYITTETPAEDITKEMLEKAKEYFLTDPTGTILIES